MEKIQNFRSDIDDKIIMITGGTGSFGHQMITELMNYNPKQIRIYSRDETKQHSMIEWLSDNPILEKIKFIIGDVRDYDRLVSTMKDVDIVFHAAALKHVPAVESHPFEAVKTNILGAYNLVRAADLCRVEKVIAISTDKAVKPVNAMGMTKALQEKLILSDEITKDYTKFSCVRYGNVLGSRGSALPVWDAKISKNKPIPITHPEMTRFFLTLHDAIELVFYSVKNTKGGEIFVKKAPASKIVDLAKVYAELKTGNPDYPLEYVGIRAGEKIDEVIVSSEEYRHSKEEQNHFIIYRETDVKSSNAISDIEYSSKTTIQLGVKELKCILRDLKWVV